MNKSEIQTMFSQYQELLAEDIDWNKEIRITTDPTYLLDMRLLDTKVFVQYKASVDDGRDENGYLKKKWFEGTIFLEFDDKRLQIIANWINSAAEQLLPRLTQEQLEEIEIYLKDHTLNFYSHNVTSIDYRNLKNNRVLLCYDDKELYPASRYNLRELYMVMYYKKNPQIIVDRKWARRHFFKMWLMFYPEVTEFEEGSIYEKFSKGGRRSIEKTNWKIFLKKIDPVHYLDVVERSTQKHKLREQKLEAVSKMDDDDLFELDIRDFDDDLFGPLGRFSEGYVEISEAQYAKLMLAVKDQIEEK
jgi:hypothetical protein